MDEGSTSTVIVKKVRRREPDTVADPWRSALVLLVLLLTFLLPSDGADRSPVDDTIASNPYWRPDEITAAAQLPLAQDFSYRGLVINEDEELVLHFEQTRPIEEAATEGIAFPVAAMPVLDPRYYARPYPVPVYIYLQMWHDRHHWSYYRLARSTEDGDTVPKDLSKLPEESVVIPEPSTSSLLLLSMLLPAFLYHRRTNAS